MSATRWGSCALQAAPRRAVVCVGVAAAVLLVIGVTGDTALDEGYVLDGANYIDWLPCVQHGHKANVSWNVSSATLCLALLATLLVTSTTYACHGCACKAGCACCANNDCDARCRLTNSLVFSWCFAAVALALFALELAVYGTAASQCRLCEHFVYGSNYTGSDNAAHCWAGDLAATNATDASNTPFRYEQRCSLDGCAPTLLYSAPLGINIVATCFAVVALLLSIPALWLSSEAVRSAVQPAPTLQAWVRPPGMMPPGLQVVGVPVASRDVLLTAIVRMGGEEEAPAAAPAPAASPLSAGARVLIERLDADARLNGQMAVVTQAADGEGDVEVTLVASGEQRRLPTDRLRLVPMDLLHL